MSETCEEAYQGSGNEFRNMIKQCVFLFTGLGLFLWLALWAKSARAAVTNEVGAFELMVKNWESDFFTDVEFSSSESCPPGYELSFKGEYSGTASGCDCLAVSFCWRKNVRYNTLSKGGCNYNETICGCDQVAATPNVTLTKAPSQAFICLKRAEGRNFQSLYKRMSANGDCESGYKKCGDVTGISKGICMPSAEDCPISEMVFAGSNPDAGKFDNQKVGTNIAVYYTRSSSSQPIVETDMKENDPCYNPGFVPISYTRRPYPLMIKPEEPSCKLDSRWFKQEYLSYGRKSTYDLNQVQYSQLPAFTIND